MFSNFKVGGGRDKFENLWYRDLNRSKKAVSALNQPSGITRSLVLHVTVEDLHSRETSRSAGHAPGAQMELLSSPRTLEAATCV